jgi:hypothetical protein
MKVCFFGSRGLYGDQVTALVSDNCTRLQCTEIITALEPIGVCQAAREFAEFAGLPLKRIPKQSERAQGQYHWRSVMCYELADYVVLIHDGVSPGTQNEFDLAVKMGIPLAYYIIREKGKNTHKVNALGF